MQDINDDMDDLFRKAAEQYPLKTDGADWQKIVAGLESASIPAAEEKEKRKRRALWLFWLLPLILLAGAVYYRSDNQPSQQTAVAKEVVKNERGNDNAQQKETKRNAESSYQLNDKKDNSSSGFSSVDANNDLKISDKKDDDGSSVQTDHKDAASLHASSNLNASSTQFSFLKKKNDGNYMQVTPGSKNNKITDAKKNFLLVQPAASSNRIDKKETQDVNRVHDDTAQVEMASMAKNNSKTDSSLNNTKADSAASVTAGSESKNKMIKAKPRKQTGFYAGVMASFDVSTIKLQRINKTGYGIELLLGYRFSKRFSVESGINWTDKKYYSTGKYFDKTKTGIPAESKIIFTNGTCAMFEIPAVVKYDFAQKKKSNLFATAGLSSYIMKDEKYTYYANHSGNYYTATKKYNNSGSNIFSVASLSIGYQLQLNKHLSLRAEPYIKMPLSGVGIAKMPITSAGISAGFTRSF